MCIKGIWNLHQYLQKLSKSVEMFRTFRILIRLCPVIWVNKNPAWLHMHWLLVLLRHQQSWYMYMYSQSGMNRYFSPWGRISTKCAITVSRNYRKFDTNEYVCVSQKNSAWLNKVIFFPFAVNVFRQRQQTMWRIQNSRNSCGRSRKRCCQLPSRAAKTHSCCTLMSRQSCRQEVPL